MIAVDANILIYAHRREVSEHVPALELLQNLASSAHPWAIPWPCVYEFFSVVTNHRIWKSAATSTYLETPRLWRGGSQRLTFRGVDHDVPVREPVKAHEEATS